MKKHFVIHPFLFGLFLVLALYSANVDEVPPSQVLLPLVVVIAGTTVVMVLAWILLRHLRKAALLTSIAVILCFSYGHVAYLTTKKIPVTSAGWNFMVPLSAWSLLLLLIWVSIFCVASYFLWQRRWGLRKLTTLLNIVGTVLVVIPVVTIIINEAIGSTHISPPPDTADVELFLPETPPDIYYIILDRYASGTTLEEVYGFKNSDFLDYLSNNGFYVASGSRSNYISTERSLASSLNMEYLDDLAEVVGETSTDYLPVHAMLQDYRVWRLLKSVGYDFIHVGSWWEPTRQNKYADVNINYSGSLPEFSGLLLRTTAIDPVGRMLGLWYDPRRTQWERSRYEFAKLSEIPENEAPTFVFAHFLLPHPEYVFNRDGSFSAPPDATELAQKGFKQVVKERYIDQLVATNRMVESLIDRILEGSDTPPIIILQADEGPIPNGGQRVSWSYEDSTDAELREKTGILNAYHLPGVDANEVLKPSITPVNSFRLVFNLYFGTSLDLLPNLTYAYSRSQPYKFYDVTERVQQGAG